MIVNVVGHNVTIDAEAVLDATTIGASLVNDVHFVTADFDRGGQMEGDDVSRTSRNQVPEYLFARNDTLGVGELSSQYHDTATMRADQLALSETEDESDSESFLLDTEDSIELTALDRVFSRLERLFDQLQ